MNEINIVVKLDGESIRRLISNETVTIGIPIEGVKVNITIGMDDN